MILNGHISKRGLLTPTSDIPSDIFIVELKKRGIDIQRKELTLFRIRNLANRFGTVFLLNPS